MSGPHLFGPDPFDPDPFDPALFDPAVNAEYMPSQRVPDARAYFTAWAERSAQVRREHPPRLLRYGPGEHETMDLFGPSGAAAGTLLFIHGGYWLAFYKDDFSYVAPALLARGWRVAVMSYDLAPAVALRHIVRQARVAASVLAQACPGPLVVAGHSAGGHLTAMIHSTDWAAEGLRAPRLTASIGISGLYDLAPLRRTELQPDLRLTEQEAFALSPLNASPTTHAPFLAAVGDLESASFLAQSRRLAEHWPRTRLWQQPGRHHFDAPDDLPALLEDVLAGEGG